jgi:hypothetical protein
VNQFLVLDHNSSKPKYLSLLEIFSTSFDALYFQPQDFFVQWITDSPSDQDIVASLSP